MSSSSSNQSPGSNWPPSETGGKVGEASAWTHAYKSDRPVCDGQVNLEINAIWSDSIVQMDSRIGHHSSADSGVTR
jgi:hypothetical protein